MPPFESNNSGILFKNTRKQEGSKQPDYEGHIEIQGQKWRLAGWLRKSQKSGATFLSLKVSEPRERGYEGSGGDW